MLWDRDRGGLRSPNLNSAETEHTSAGCPLQCGGHRNLEPISTSPDDARRSCKCLHSGRQGAPLATKGPTSPANRPGISITLKDRHAPWQPKTSCAERPTPSRRWHKAGLMEVVPIGHAWLANKKDPSGAMPVATQGQNPGTEGARPPKNMLVGRRRRPNGPNSSQPARRSLRQGCSAFPLSLVSCRPRSCISAHVSSGATGPAFPRVSGHLPLRICDAECNSASARKHCCQQAALNSWQRELDSAQSPRTASGACGCAPAWRGVPLAAAAK